MVTGVLGRGCAQQNRRGPERGARSEHRVLARRVGLRALLLPDVRLPQTLASDSPGLHVASTGEKPSEFVPLLQVSRDACAARAAGRLTF